MFQTHTHTHTPRCAEQRPFNYAGMPPPLAIAALALVGSQACVINAHLPGAALHRPAAGRVPAPLAGLGNSGIFCQKMCGLAAFSSQQLSETRQHPAVALPARVYVNREISENHCALLLSYCILRRTALGHSRTFRRTQKPPSLSLMLSRFECLSTDLPTVCNTA